MWFIGETLMTIGLGEMVIVRNLAGRPELDGSHGWVLDYSHETGLYELDLEGVEIVKMVPEQCPQCLDTNWLVNMRDLENKIEAGRQERYKKFASEQAKEETERNAKIKAAAVSVQLALGYRAESPLTSWQPSGQRPPAVTFPQRLEDSEPSHPVTAGHHNANQHRDQQMVTSNHSDHSAQAALQESAPVRADLEGRMRMGLRTGDAEMRLGCRSVEQRLC
eukprot:Skav221454  [mRNA]  locus=scaffold1700:178425:181624:- [translate_table: standard]